MTAVARAKQAPVVRTFAALGVDRSSRLIASTVFAVALVWAFLAFWPGNSQGVAWIRDAQPYYGAAERLNAGHEIYRYLPGDRILKDEPFYNELLLSPPLIAVAWRPVAALLPLEPAIVIWWALGAFVLSATVFWLIAHAGLPTVWAVTALCVPLALTAWTGNVQAFLTPAIILASVRLWSGHERLGGAIYGLGTVLKLSPVFLCWWLVVTGRRKAVAAAIVVGMAAIAISVVGSGIGAYVDYLGVVGRVAGLGGTGASVTGVARALGVPLAARSLIMPLLIVVGIVVVLLLRSRPRAAFAAAVIFGVLSSTVNNTNVTLLLAAFLPFGDPSWAPSASSASPARPADEHVPVGSQS